MFGWNGPARPKVVAFDVIGTLFPLDPLRPLVQALGLPPTAVDAVYATALRDSFALSAIGRYQPFMAALAAALDEVLLDHGLRAPARAKTAVLNGMKLLTPRPDAAAAFRTLNAAGIGVAMLSNGSRRATQALLQRAGLAPLVDLVASAETVGLSKPRPEVYRHMARLAGVKPRHLALVAVHAWDINGAREAGLTTAYVTAERPFSPLMPAPTLTAPTLAEAARRLAAL